MAIFIISRRPLAPWHETAWSYRNRFTADNAAVSADVRRDAAYRSLKLRAESMAHSWRIAEPDTQFRVIDTGVNNVSDKFEQPVDAPVEKAAPEPTVRVELVCPACGKTSVTVQPASHAEPPKVNCGDCLIDRVEVVEMKVVDAEVVS